MSHFLFYLFTIAYILFLIGAYQAFRYNSSKRSIIILSIAFMIDVFAAFCGATGFLAPRLDLGINFYMILGWICGLFGYSIFLVSCIPYKKCNLQLHQRVILIAIILIFLANQFWSKAVIELLAPFKPVLP